MEPKLLSPKSVRRRMYHVIFEAESHLGRAFDVALILAILLSVVVVMLDSVASFRESHGSLLWTLEWILTLIFTVEYMLRLSCVASPRKYALSFFGVIDLLAILPTFIALALPSAKYLLVVRILRILRVFRVLKLVTYVRESNQLSRALWATRRKIVVFLFAVFTIVIVLGSLMYLIEGEEHGFSSIPRGVYWAVVTLTTVGYGDIAPQTPAGQAVAMVVMVLGYGIIAVPTGIVTAELTSSSMKAAPTCSKCQSNRTPEGASFCCDCGAELPAGSPWA
ncbi:MAG: ion transporter [Planctomycetes bacterium]|nr:ion transporter [Planctomycetota bacterium]